MEENLQDARERETLAGALAKRLTAAERIAAALETLAGLGELREGRETQRRAEYDQLWRAKQEKPR